VGTTPFWHPLFTGKQQKTRIKKKAQKKEKTRPDSGPDIVQTKAIGAFERVPSLEGGGKRRKKMILKKWGEAEGSGVRPTTTRGLKGWEEGVCWL